MTPPEENAQKNGVPAAEGQNPEEAGAGLPRADQPATPDYYDQLLRLRAEFENYRKRVEREKSEFYRFGRSELVARLLPLYDLLRRAHREIQTSHAQSDVAKGMEGIFREFEKIFKEENVSPIEALNKPFDPLRHEALGVVEAPGVAEETVVEVLEEGYAVGQRVLRTAKVRVAGKAKTQEAVEKKSKGGSHEQDHRN